MTGSESFLAFLLDSKSKDQSKSDSIGFIILSVRFAACLQLSRIEDNTGTRLPLHIVTDGGEQGFFDSDVTASLKLTYERRIRP
jgi:hypothetical protein